MLRNPGEGHFWQVDHIKPVYEGGGQCSLDNLQTLCTVCHKEVSDNHTCVLVQAALGGGELVHMGGQGWASLQPHLGADVWCFLTLGSVEMHCHRCGTMAATLFIHSLRMRLSG